MSTTTPAHARCVMNLLEKAKLCVDHYYLLDITKQFNGFIGIIRPYFVRMYIGFQGKKNLKFQFKIQKLTQLAM